MGERDAIGDSDQGRSFRAFWDFLMSSRRQEALSGRLDQVLALPAVAALNPEPRTRRVHHDWLEAGEHTQRTVAQLSQQLRRFLDDRAFLENRRILELLHGIESKALALRGAPPLRCGDADRRHGCGHRAAAGAAAVHAHGEAAPGRGALEAGADDIDTARLFDQIVVDKARLRRRCSMHCATSRRSRCASCWMPSPCSRAWPSWWPGWSWPTPAMAATRRGPARLVDEAVEEPIRWQAENAAGEAVTREARCRA
jgi:hypothetical protein